MEAVNEQSTAVVTASFFDEDGGAVTPAEGVYRIDDAKSRTEILGDTALPSLAPSVDIVITAEQNCIIGTSRYEKHLLTVTFKYAGGKSGADEYPFYVKNLAMLPGEEDEKEP